MDKEVLLSLRGASNEERARIVREALGDGRIKIRESGRIGRVRSAALNMGLRIASRLMPIGFR